MAPAMPSTVLEFTYINWRGETSHRTVVPERVWFGSTEWHQEPQWLLKAYDLERKAMRDFALIQVINSLARHPFAAAPVEAAAEAIYAHLPYEGPGAKPEWVPRGNSLKQDEARRYARVAIEAAGLEGSRAATDVLDERRRQIEVEGWSVEHDDQHSRGELAKAGGCYALFADPKAFPRFLPPGPWPWAAKWWKPQNRRRDLVRAAALIIAEIERLDRSQAKGGENGR